MLLLSSINLGNSSPRAVVRRTPAAIQGQRFARCDPSAFEGIGIVAMRPSSCSLRSPLRRSTSCWCFQLGNRLDTRLVVELELGQFAIVKSDHLAFAVNVQLAGLIWTQCKAFFFFAHAPDRAPMRRTGHRRQRIKSVLADVARCSAWLSSYSALVSRLD